MRWTLAGLALGTACAGDTSAYVDTYTEERTDGAALDTGSGSSTRPPEQEESRVFRPPAQTPRYVLVANPDRDTLTRVTVEDLQVITTEVGSNPTIVRTTADHARAVVLNEGDDTISVVVPETMEWKSSPVRPNLDRMELSPSGQHAVLWRDSSNEAGGGIQSFNEASIVDIGIGRHSPMAVGFNPRDVRFTPDGTLAVIVSDAVLATVDLTQADLVPRLVELEPDRLDAPTAQEVILAADGSFAWVRQFGTTDLLAVELDSGAIDRVPAGGNPTDLDLSPDGTQAIAVARASRELWVYDAADPGLAPTVIDLPAGSNYGSLLVDPSGEVGILYTTATLDERFAVWDRSTGTIRERSLVKPVAAMAINPTGDALLVLHTRADGPNTDPTFAGQSALTMVALDDLRSNPLLLPADPTAFAASDDGTWGAFIMEGQPYLEVLDFQTLLHRQIRLRSDPQFLGVLPDPDITDDDASAVWVSQAHPLGRISFYDRDDDSLDTLTGFELNSDIESN